MSKSESLLSSYRKEKSCYIRVLELAGILKESLRDGSPMQDILSILRSKNEIMNEIEAIERSIEKEKREYRSGSWKPGDVAEAIDELSVLVEKILSVERENEILFSCAGHNHNRPVSTGASSDYACRRYADIISGESA